MHALLTLQVIPRLTDSYALKLPLTIDPCPIVDAAVEVRFEPTVPDDAVFGLVYQTLRAEFPKSTALPMASMPPAVRKADPALANLPLHMLQGERFTILVSSQSVAVSIRGAYPGWRELSPYFQSTMDRLAQTGLFEKPDRFGLRYINFFEGDLLPRLALDIAIGGLPVTGSGTFFKTVLPDRACQLLLQVGKDVALATRPQKPGTIIDIDAFDATPIVKQGFAPGLASFLERAHSAEKDLFFKLLKPEFLVTLNPIYDNVQPVESS